MAFSKLLGCDPEVDLKKIKNELDNVLLPNEEVTMVFQVKCEDKTIPYKIIRNLFLFTDHRLILVEKQGSCDRKMGYHSIPYTSIAHFSIQTVGRFDLDSVLKIRIIGQLYPLEREFKKGTNIHGIQKTLAHFIFPKNGVGVLSKG